MKKIVLLFGISIIISSIFTRCKTEPEPKACFSVSSSAINAGNNPIVGEEITFENCSEDADSYLWDFGDNDNSQKESPTHIYKQGGEYVVAIEATNNEGTTIATNTVNILSLDGTWNIYSTVQYADGAYTFEEELDLEQDEQDLKGAIIGDGYDSEIEDATVDGYEIVFSVAWVFDGGTEEIWVYGGNINEDYDEMEGEFYIVVDGENYGPYEWGAEKTSSKSTHLISGSNRSRVKNKELKLKK